MKDRENARAIAMQESCDTGARVAKQTPDDRSAPPAGWQVTTLADGSTRLTLAGRARWRMRFRQEWHVQRGQIERWRTWLGVRRVKRFMGGALWLEYRRRGGAVGRALVVRAGRDVCTIAVDDEGPLRAVGVL